ncbi:MAG: hypothetical protein ABMB14_32600, partial [Myxococcota bacterium]
GVAIDLVFPDTSADGHLIPGDVLLEIDGLTVANNGTVYDDAGFGPVGPPGGDGNGRADGLWMDLLAIVDRHQVGDALQVRILRDGARTTLAVTLKAWQAAARFADQHDKQPRYYVYGGLVFVPLDLEMLKIFGWEWRSTADKVLLHEFLLRPYRDPDQWRKERVVLMRRLDHPVNSTMAWYQNMAVERVNGRDITGLADLIDALATNVDRFQVIEFSNNRLAVLDRAEAEHANPEILERYGVARDRNL